LISRALACGVAPRVAPAQTGCPNRKYQLEFLGASGALAALAIPVGAAIELYGGGGIWISSGQTDLTPAALASSLWAIFKRVGPRNFRGIGRFWTYDPSGNPTGFGTVDQTTTVSEDGKTYHGEGPPQFFDNAGNPLGPATTIFDDGKRITFP
jgi:hypothetical protein